MEQLVAVEGVELAVMETLVILQVKRHQLDIHLVKKEVGVEVPEKVLTLGEVGLIIGNLVTPLTSWLQKEHLCLRLTMEKLLIVAVHMGTKTKEQTV